MTEARDDTAWAGDSTISSLAGKDGIVHAQTRAFLSYWEGLRRGQIVPYRSQVDPRYMHCDIGNLFIVEALEDGSQRFRVAGSRIVDMMGMELRGLPVRTIMDPGDRDALGTLIEQTLGLPARGYSRLHPAAGGTGLWEMLLLPLRSDNGNIDRLIGFLLQLSGGRSLDGLMPLRLTFERRAVQRIERPGNRAEPAVAAGFGEEQRPFALGPAPETPVRLTAIDGGGAGRPSDGRRPALKLIDKG